MALVIAISNEKGGVGKTIISIELAQELKRKGYKILVIDCDKQSDATKFYGASNENGVATVVDILYDDNEPSECIQHCDNGDVIAGDPQLKFAEQRILRDGNEYRHLKEGIEKISDLYDFIIVDTPRGYGIVLQNILVAADYVIIPVDTQGTYALDGLTDFIIDVDKFTRNNNPDVVKLGIIANLYRSNVRSHNENIANATDIAEAASIKHFLTSIPMTDAISNGITKQHKPLYKYTKSEQQQKAQKQIEQFVVDVLKEIKKTPKGMNLKIRKNKE